MSNNDVVSLGYFDIHKNPYYGNCHINFASLPRPYHIISYMTEGDATFYGNSNTIHLKKGDAFYIPMGETYQADIYGNGTFYNMAMYFTFLPESDPLRDKEFILQKLDDTINDSVVKLLDRIYDNKGDIFPVMSDFYKICDLVFSTVTYTTKSVKSNPIHPALDYIYLHYKEIFPIKHLADLCNLSESRFYHLFNEITGMSPITYKNKVNIGFAICALQSEKDKSIEYISQEYGFSSSTYFRKMVKKFTGKSPSQIRNDSL